MLKRVPFLRGRGKCIFCERQPPAVKMSREHIFADWLREYFPRDATTTHTHGTITWPTPYASIEQGVFRAKRLPGHSGSRKVKAICEPCNNEWMSNKLEELAKPILIPMLASRPLELIAETQRVLAAWVTKTVMVADYLDRARSVIQQHERTHLMNNLTPPPVAHMGS